MVISRTPFRVSFFGGGTDYPAWFCREGGAVLSCTINRYCYIMARFLPPFFDKGNRIVWSKIEQVDRIDQIEHPVVRASLELLDIHSGVEIHHQGDLPARSGIGSSSTFTVGLLHALHGLLGRMRSKEALAQEAIHVEQSILQENVGVQDQIAAAFGGLNFIEISTDGNFRVQPLMLTQARAEEFQSRMLLFYTGISRNSSEIAGETIRSIRSKNANLTTIREMVDQSLAILQSNTDLSDLGRLLHESWLLKRSLSKAVATSLVDEVYQRAMRAGADGGKLLGAGGGGFLLFLADPARHGAIRNALSDLLSVPAQFDHGGSQIIYYNTES